jgi:AraC-like DNA-binding protein
MIQNIPESYLQAPRQHADFFVYDFKMTTEVVKSKVNLTANMFSFLQMGEKKVHVEHGFVEVNNKQSVLIRSGNCLMTEILDKERIYFCKLFFFTDHNISLFLKKHADTVGKFEKKSPSEAPFFVIENDAFIHSFVTSISTILSLNSNFEALLGVKFEEILLYLTHKYGAPFINFLQTLASSNKKTSFKHRVEAHIHSDLNLIEIAFLCHMSLSTFKRHFKREYNVNPGKWLQEKRLAIAKHLLEHEGKKPSEIHKQLGYNTLSNFSAAFKNAYGIRPKELLRREYRRI